LSSASISAEVAKWAAELQDAAEELGIPASERVPLGLAQIDLETGGTGDPALRNSGSNAIGLGQQFSYVDGKKYAPDSPPYVSPEGELAGFPVSWNPRDQVRALLGTVEYHRKANDANLPAALWAYASGGGNVSKAVKGLEVAPVVTRHRDTYLPKIAAKERAYASWYAGWVEAGRPDFPEGTLEFETPDGAQAWPVEFAQVAITPLEPGPSPFDGTWRWKGQTYQGAPKAGAGGTVTVTGEVEPPEPSGPGLGTILLVGGGLLGVALAGIFSIASKKDEEKKRKRKKRQIEKGASNGR